jgi:aminopeptidase YwaD
MKPHYLNDFVIEKFKAQGKRANWIVNTNPYEGGSDHVPFLRGNIPSVLFWHFTDQFYHTDNDRIDKVSKETLKNVSTAALVSAFTLINADENTAKNVLKNIESAAVTRINEELKQGKLAIDKGEKLKTQKEIIAAWQDWYIKATETVVDMVSDINLIQSEIEKTQAIINNISKKNTALLDK